MRPFYLYKTHRGIYYVQFLNEHTGKRLSPHSTFQKTYSDAFKVACDWFQNGLPTKGYRKPISSIIGVDTLLAMLKSDSLDQYDIDRVSALIARKSINFNSGVSLVSTRPNDAKIGLVAFLDAFWNYDKSPYVQDKLIHRQRMGRRHCHDSRQRISHWRDYFTETAKLADVTTEDLKSFERYLAAKKLSTASLNHIMLIGKTAFKWAVTNKKLSEDPCIGLTRYGKDTKLRDILTEDEAKKLFAVKWIDERARVASLVAMTCGLRMGEILALRPCDVSENRLCIRHSWSALDGLKTPKNGKTREVPLLPSVKAALAKLATINPYGWDAGRFIFYGTIPEKPVVENVLVEGFKDALVRSGVSEDARKKRNIVFHSWRHYYAKVIADRVDQRQAQLALGHMTAAMTSYYADHKTEGDLVAIERAVGEAFSDALGG